MECNDGQDCVNNEYDDGGEEFIEEIGWKVLRGE